MTGVSVIGAGLLPFGRHEDRTLAEMAVEAAFLAIRDSGIAPQAIEAGFFANVLGGHLFGDFTIGQGVFADVGVTRGPIVNVENACASGSTAFTMAHNAIAAGEVETAIVLGAEKMCVPGLGLLDSGASELETKLGLVTPASFGLRAQRHMYEFGTTSEQLAQVSVKNRAHAAANPQALFQQSVTIDEVLDSPMIADPLTRYQCCPIADGAAALVLAGGKTATTAGRAIKIDAAILCSGSYETPIDLVRWETDRRGCRLAYEKAGVGPGDLDLVECHDAFSIAEIMHYEALDLCAEGEGGRLVAEGVTALGGKIPVNVSGGLIGRGHPLSATGVAQIIEIVTQLRGEAGARQVDGARVGLAHCMGADRKGDARSCTVAILSR